MALKRGNLDLLVMILIPIFIGLGFEALTIWSITQIRERKNLYSATTGIVTAMKHSPHFGDQSKAAWFRLDCRGIPDWRPGLSDRGLATAHASTPQAQTSATQAITIVNAKAAVS